MDLAVLTPAWLDSLLIAPFRLPGSPHAGLWLGSAVLACWCVILGELTSTIIFLLGRKHYLALQDKMVKAHNLSVQALHSGDKAAYLAVNREAHEHFGKNFFAEAGIGISSLWPVPFALGWMALRFEGITLYAVPGTSLQTGYVFVFLILYIAERVVFSRYVKRRLPLFRQADEIRRKAREARGPIRSFFASRLDRTGSHE